MVFGKAAPGFWESQLRSSKRQKLPPGSLTSPPEAQNSDKRTVLQCRGGSMKPGADRTALPGHSRARSVWIFSQRSKDWHSFVLCPLSRHLPPVSPLPSSTYLPPFFFVRSDAEMTTPTSRKLKLCTHPTLSAGQETAPPLRPPASF